MMKSIKYDMDIINVNYINIIVIILINAASVIIIVMRQDKMIPWIKYMYSNTNLMVPKRSLINFYGTYGNNSLVFK